MRSLNLIEQGNANPNFETVFLSKEGKKVFVGGSVNCRFDNGKPTAFRCILNDYTEKIRAEKAQSLYYSIANWTVNTQNLDDFYHSIHRGTWERSLMFKTSSLRFTIQVKAIIYFPYYVDQYFKGNVRFTKRRLGNGVTEYAIASNKPLFLSEYGY